MICMKRNKRPFYLCKKIPNTTKFDKPIPCNLNYQPTNSVGERLTLGEDYSMYLKMEISAIYMFYHQKNMMSYVKVLIILLMVIQQIH